MNRETREQLLAMGFAKADMELTLGSYETMDKAFAFADSQIELDPDLMYTRFILCHEGVNANGDYFTKEVLQRAQFTPRNKPIDWEHGQPIIGTMLDSRYAEDSNGRGYIEAVGVVWKFIYPELSGDIKKKSATGELRLSMECYYKDANYAVGETIYSQEEAQKLNLIQYVGRDYMGQKVTRVFNEVVFGGVGVVANPADKEAVFLSVAKDLQSHGINVDVTSSLDTEEVAGAIAQAINRVVNDFRVKQASPDTVSAVTVAKYVKAFDKAKSSIVSKFNKDGIQGKSQFISELNSSINTFLAEIASINNNFYKGVASENLNGSIADKLSEHYGENAGAYLQAVSEDYFIYELVDYSQSYPDSVKLLKGSYSIVDGLVEIHYDSAIEVDKIYVEKAMQNTDELEEKEEMSKANTEVVETAQADETVETVEETVVATEETPVVEDSTDYKAEASALTEKVASLTTQLEEASSAKASLEQRVAELESQLGEIEAEKVYASRLAELEGFALSDKRKASIKTMTDEDFSDFKELLTEVAGAKTVEQPVVVASEEEVTEEVVEEAEASEEEVEIVVETPRASAGLNIETEGPKSVKPFGHLSSN